MLVGIQCVGSVMWSRDHGLDLKASPYRKCVVLVLSLLEWTVEHLTSVTQCTQLCATYSVTIRNVWHAFLMHTIICNVPYTCTFVSSVLVLVLVLGFYRASACRARYCFTNSVRLSVCSSNAGLVSKRIPTAVRYKIPMRTPLSWALNKYMMVWKICDFQPKSPFISETVRNRLVVIVDQ